ncbi:MAG: DUF5668 domain-containing protein [Candidatus Margulisiibacteriota bacterium]|jgi:hypothetical protein
MKNKQKFLISGLLLIIIGLIILFLNFDFLEISFNILKYWPLIFIWLGIELIIRYFYNK